MMNMNILAVLTPPSIYHGCYTWKTSWEGNFTVGEFSAVNMKTFGHSNVMKDREIKGSYKYVTLEIWLKFFSLERMRITSSESKDNLGRSEKGIIASLGLKAKSRPKKCKKAGYAILNGSNKNLLNIIK